MTMVSLSLHTVVWDHSDWIALVFCMILCGGGGGVGVVVIVLFCFVCWLLYNTQHCCSFCV